MKDLESQVTVFLDRHFREVQYCVYGLGIFGLYKITKSVRIFSRFEHPRKIPSDYYSNGIKLYGRIRSTRVHNDLDSPITLLIEHVPILSLRTGKSITPLKVDLAGVCGTPSTVELLQRYSNRTVWIKLYGTNKERDEVYASVSMTTSWKFWRERDLAKILLKSDSSAKVSEYPTNLELNDLFPAYYRNLLQYEAKYRYTPPSLVKRIAAQIRRLFKRDR